MQCLGTKKILVKLKFIQISRIVEIDETILKGIQVVRMITHLLGKSVETLADSGFGNRVVYLGGRSVEKLGQWVGRCVDTACDGEWLSFVRWWHVLVGDILLLHHVA